MLPQAHMELCSTASDQDATGPRGSIKLCTMLQSKEISNEKKTKKNKMKNLLNCPQSAQKLVCTHKCLYYTGEGKNNTLRVF